MARHILTPEQLQFIKDNAAGLYNKELAVLFNEKFGTNLSWESLRAWKKYYRVKSGIDGKIKPGNELWKHVKDNKKKANSKSFVSGHISPTFKEVGSEKIDSEGYIWIKIKNPRTWREKAQVIWEVNNGPIPKCHVVIFGDSNKLNCDISNLILVSRKQLIRLNKLGFITEDIDLTRTGIVVVDLLIKIKEMETNAKHTRRS